MAQISSSAPLTPRLRRELGTFGVVSMGLGAIVGTGVFVGIGLAAGIAGPSVLLATLLAGGLAICNGLSSAQLAIAFIPAKPTNLPGVSIAYEHGYRLLHPLVGFSAGWLFLWAKSASAATAALALAGYVLTALDLNDPLWRIGLGLAVVVIVTVSTLGGFRQSPWGSAALMTLVVGSLLIFMWAGWEQVAQHGSEWFAPFFPPPSAGTSPVRALFHAAALMFVAFSGHGRIAELSADARDAERTIPRGVVIALITAMGLYLLVGATALGTVGAETFARMTLDTAAPLELIAGGFGIPGARELLVVAAVIALLGVLYNLVLGMSRLLAAMGRRLDMPARLGRANAAGRTSDVAVVATGVLVAAMVFIGDIRVTWEFSAFAALFYYALTNLTAYYLPADQRRYPRVVAAIGLLACLFLAFWVNVAVWVAGLAVIAAGLGWRWAIRRL